MNRFIEMVEGMLVEGENVGRVNGVGEVVKFIEKRAQGAKRIEDAAMVKGGYAKLTGIHFKAKEVPYRVCGKYVGKDNVDGIKDKVEECMRRLKGWEGMSQREFQHIMGQMEAYGEVYLECKGKFKREIN